MAKNLYWLAVALLLALAWSVPGDSASKTKCVIDGSECERLKACAINCKNCEAIDRCCCKHKDTCNCVDPTTGDACCP